MGSWGARRGGGGDAWGGAVGMASWRARTEGGRERATLASEPLAWRLGAPERREGVSGEGAPAIEIDGAANLSVVVIASLWHTTVMDGLLDGSRRALAEAGVQDVTELRVPGVFELTVAASRVTTRPVDAVVALGVVIRGGTPHFEYVCDAATTGLTLVSQRTGVPIGFGVLTCDDEEQAVARAGLSGSIEDKGYEAAVAALATAVTLSSWSRPK